MIYNSNQNGHLLRYSEIVDIIILQYLLFSFEWPVLKNTFMGVFIHTQYAIACCCTYECSVFRKAVYLKWFMISEMKHDVRLC